MGMGEEMELVARNGASLVISQQLRVLPVRRGAKLRGRLLAAELLIKQPAEALRLGLGLPSTYTNLDGRSSASSCPISGRQPQR